MATARKDAAMMRNATSANVAAKEKTSEIEKEEAVTIRRKEDFIKMTIKRQYYEKKTDPKPVFSTVCCICYDYECDGTRKKEF